MSHFAPHPSGRDDRPAILVAASPSAQSGEFSLEHVLAIEEAVLSFVRATLAAGHRVLVIADPALAALAAAVAGEYAAGDRAGQASERPLVEVLEPRRGPGASAADGEEDRNHGVPAGLDGFVGAGRGVGPDDLGELATVRHAIAFMVVGDVDPAQLEPLLMRRDLNRGIVAHTIPYDTRAKLADHEVDHADVVTQELGESDALSVIAGEPGPLPLPYLMQRFVSRWSDGEDEPRPREWRRAP